MTEARDVAAHYGRGQILEAILRALESTGKDLGRLVPADLGRGGAVQDDGAAATGDPPPDESDHPEKTANMASNLGEGRVVVILAVAEKCRVTPV